MLQIRLNPKGVASEGTGGGKSLPVEIVTVACPDHLILADLPVAKSIGTTSTSSVIKIVGRKSRRHLGERVHFCVRCDFPIAIYGRLSPCEHAFCLDCARSDSSCYLCEERIQKIQTIKMMEGILICAAPHCLKSFMKKSEFEGHLIENHSDLLQPNMAKEDGSQVDAFNAMKPSSTESHAKHSIGVDTSTARTQPRTSFSPISNSQINDFDDKARQNQPRDQPTLKPVLTQPKPPSFSGRNPNYPPEMPSENNAPSGFDRRGTPGRFNNQQNYDMQPGTPHGRDSDRTPDHPPQSHQPPNFVVPINANQGLPPGYNISPIRAEGAQQFYNNPYENARPDMPSENGPGQGSVMGFPSVPAGGMNFSESYPPPWNMGSTGMSFEQMPPTRGMSEGDANQPDVWGRANSFQGDYGRQVAIPLNPLMRPMGTRGLEPPQGSNVSDNNGMSAQQPRPPFPPPPNHLSQFQRGNFSGPGDVGREGQNYGWQHEKRDGY